jgi:hypothetical protein
MEAVRRHHEQFGVRCGPPPMEAAEGQEAQESDAAGSPAQMFLSYAGISEKRGKRQTAQQLAALRDGRD